MMGGMYNLPKWRRHILMKGMKLCQGMCHFQN